MKKARKRERRRRRGERERILRFVYLDFASYRYALIPSLLEAFLSSSIVLPFLSASFLPTYLIARCREINRDTLESGQRDRFNVSARAHRPARVPQRNAKCRVDTVSTLAAFARLPALCLRIDLPRLDLGPIPAVCESPFLSARPQ